ncbi:hypothetical protein ACWCP6_24455 [Streptomyces sp. NPDC002004]
MMRRIGTVLGVCAAAAALALAAPGSANAAWGVLIIDGAAHLNPRGCFPLGDFAPPVVINETASVAEVWTGPNCTGQVEWLIHPGEIYHPRASRSVFIF